MLHPDALSCAVQINDVLSIDVSQSDSCNRETIPSLDANLVHLLIRVDQNCLKVVFVFQRIFSLEHRTLDSTCVQEL